MKIIECDLIPRKYHLRWDSLRKAIVIEIHKDCVRGALTVPPTHRWINDMCNNLGWDDLFDSLSFDLKSDSFGFNKAVRKSSRSDQSSDYVEYFVPIPRIITTSGLTCEDCCGRKKDEYDRKCNYCNGTGQKQSYDWKQAYVVTASLGFLFNILDQYEGEIATQDYQQVSIDTIWCEHGAHGSSVGGCFGIEFSDYLLSDPGELQTILLNDATLAMKLAWGRLLTLDDWDRNSIRCSCENGYLIMDCPGDACGIHFSDHGRRSGRGADFTCHNMDNPAQALTILAGIASLVGQADLYISTAKEKRKFSLVR